VTITETLILKSLTHRLLHLRRDHLNLEMLSREQTSDPHRHDWGDCNGRKQGNRTRHGLGRDKGRLGRSRESHSSVLRRTRL